MNKKKGIPEGKEVKKEEVPGRRKSEDIYEQGEKLADIDPDELSKIKPQLNKEESVADDLDIPGSELDDADEEIGEEDEENNYYSIGGDNHENLEEDQG